VAARLPGRAAVLRPLPGLRPDRPALAWLDRAELRRLRRADWLEAAKLSLVGNIVYYLFLASALQRAGGPCRR
jgi:hypothetical protein